MCDRVKLNTPKYAILDECTSAVTLEIEKVMYDHATGKQFHPFLSHALYKTNDPDGHCSTWYHTHDGISSTIIMEIPLDGTSIRRNGRLRLVNLTVLSWSLTLLFWYEC